MPLSVKEETLATITDYYHHESYLKWPSPFTLPVWMRTWWQSFGQDYELFLLSARDENGNLHGIAPMMRSADTAYLLGNPDVCDYLDFINRPGNEEGILSAFINYAAGKGIDQIKLHAQRPDAIFFQADKKGVISRNYSISVSDEDWSYEVELPAAWEEYLGRLNKKQRHEVRRKIRKLDNEKPGYSFQVISDPYQIEENSAQFFQLFLQNEEKAQFMTASMKVFFKNILINCASENLLKMGLLKVDHQTAAAVLFFVYNNRIYLYNSGYRNDYRELSVGLLSKVFLLKYSLENGFRVYDFLKGQEVYKERLGGLPIPIYQVIIRISKVD